MTAEMCNSFYTSIYISDQPLNGNTFNQTILSQIAWMPALEGFCVPGIHNEKPYDLHQCNMTFVYAFNNRIWIL